MKIRKTTEADLDRIMDIYARAREFMAETGNPDQWGPTNWPPIDLIRSDISEGNSYVCVNDEGDVTATFFFVQGEDIEPTYREITDGEWGYTGPYGVVHRLASDGTEKGTGRFCLEWAFGQCGHLRVDTHTDNKVMQNLLTDLGFRKRGIIYVVEDDFPRFAYDKKDTGTVHSSATPLFDHIAKAVTDGELPNSFSLPDPEGDGDMFAFADGAMDGIGIYHMEQHDMDAEEKELMASAVMAAAGRNTERDMHRAEELFEKLGKKKRAIDVRSELISYCTENKDDLKSGELYETALYMLLNSTDRECVKFGLILLELLDTGRNESLKQDIRTIGLSDEFTLFAVNVMQTWRDGNSEIFDLAKKVHGWGRIHATERIKPNASSIKKWLLTEAVINDVSYAYSALTCWNKSDALFVLKNHPDHDQFAGIGRILLGLLDEGPVAGISSIKNRDEIIGLFLDEAEKMPLEPDDYQVIREIYTYCGKNKGTGSAPALKSKEILLSGGIDIDEVIPEDNEIIPEEEIEYGKEALDILADAVSDVGSWRWWVADEEMVQLEFCDVQLYDDTKKEKAPHSSIIAIRFYGDYFAVLLDSLDDADWYVRLHNDELEPFPLDAYELSFDDVKAAKQVMKSYRRRTPLRPRFDESLFSSAKHILSGKCQGVGFVVGGDSIEVVGHPGIYTAGSIEEGNKRWWEYRKDYRRLRGTPDAYEEDYACEVTIPIEK